MSESHDATALSAALDTETARDTWDRAADTYAGAQARGRDHYRYAFFGPAQVELCGDVRGLTMLDLGCGAGYFAREMASRGARVTGVDLAPRMIEHASRIERETPLGIEYVVGDAADVAHLFAPGSFDMATSCLALQDMPDIPSALGAVHVVVRPGGRLVVSIAHPCTDTPFREWRRHEDGRKHSLAIDRYFERGPIRYTWRGWGEEFTTYGMHATLEDWMRWILDAGWTLAGLVEPEPTAAALAAHPDLEDAARVPYFLLLDLRR